MARDDDPLQRYRGKRDFSLTPEPDGGAVPRSRAAAATALSFVVQKHWASRLHYDFRLEWAGTMKSWAVPKGPSFDPKVKRMAVEVEDHPVSYSSFEGTIPEGQYGAGKVIVWDRGSWVPIGDAGEGLREGSLKFELRGVKLNGRWALVRMKGRNEKQPPWLLIKEKDEAARPEAEFSVVDEMPDSVVSGTRRFDRLSANGGGTRRLDTLGANGGGTQRFDTLGATGGGATKAKARAKSAAREPLPDWIAPQLATLVEAPPGDGAAWAAEVKLDGYRLMCRIDAGGPRLFTRNAKDWSAKLAPLQRALASAKLPPGWYDGEMVALNAAGLPDFSALQQALDASGNAARRPLVLYLFDLPFGDGQDLRTRPLAERRARLQALLEGVPDDQIRFSATIDGPLDALLASACKIELEGLIAKRLDCVYRSGRSTDWIKLKCRQRQEFVIGGYTDPQGSRSGLGSLLLGVHEGQGAGAPLVYAGRVGSGFDERTLRELKAALDARIAKASPFAPGAAIEGRPHWVRPGLVAEVSFAEWTRGGHVRQAVFHGLRKDKEAQEVMREVASERAEPPRRAPEPGAELRVSNPERVIDAASGTTKIDLVRYYGLVGKLMMEHVAGRPVALLRAPSGLGGELFFQKHVASDRIRGLRALDGAADEGDEALIEVATASGLTAAAQWNVVEFHTGNQRRPMLARPDRVVFDLDPGEGVAWAQVQEAAELVRGFLEQLELPAFLKTSGGKGLHLVVPLRRLHDWDTVKGFSQAVVEHLARTVPQRFVAKSGPKNRVGRIFVDYLRNGQGATTVAAWSARARPGLGISVPVAWSELAGLKGGDHWRVATVHERLAQGNEPWQGYAEAARGIGAAIKRLKLSR